MSKTIIKITNKTEAYQFIYRLLNYLDRPDFKGITFEVVSEKPKRSLQQNKYYWGVVIEKAVDFYKQNIRLLIVDLMEAMNFALTPDFIHELFKMLFNGGKSTTGLKTDEMMNYQDKIRHHFLHKYGVDIPPPNEEEILITKEVKDE